MPGKFRTLLKHHVSDKVYRVIGRYPKSAVDTVSHLETTRSKTKDGLKKSNRTKSEPEDLESFLSEDSGSLLDFDLKPHKLKRQRKSSNDSEEDEDERYFGLTPEVERKSRDERLLCRIESKEKNILNQKIKDFKKRPKSNNAKCKAKVLTTGVKIPDPDDLERELDDLFD